MKTILKIHTIVALLTGFSYLTFGQGVGINTTSEPADESAILDVSSTTQGMLAPRMTTAQREAIASPATGLLVFDNETGSFWFYTGTEWNDLAAEELPISFTGSNVLAGEGAGQSMGNNTVVGNANVAIGFEALRDFQGPASGSGNAFHVAVGWGSASRTTEVAFSAPNTPENPSVFPFLAYANVSVGARTLEQNTTGAHNVTMGYQANQRNTIGADNTSIGSYALNKNTSGSKNVTTGFRSLQENTVGNANVAIGFDAGFNGTTNENCTYIGAFAQNDAPANSYTNSTAIGHQATITADNQVRIGNADVTSIGGQVDWSTLSDGRYKVNVAEDVPGLDFIMRLRPVTYNVDKSKLSKKFNNTDGSVSSTVETGFIAQEVEKAAQESAFEFDAVNPPKNENDYYTLSYAKLVVPLTKAVQELQLLIDRQTEEIASLKAEVETLKKHDGRSIKANAKNTTASLD